jgi:hypothetical protein
MASAYEDLVKALRASEEDVVKGYGGNRAAATRARKTLMNAREALNDCRKELLACGKGPDKGGTEPRDVTAQFNVEDAE